jgi:malate permease and related proteins
MNSAIIKTLSLFLMIVIGFLLRNKIKSKDQKEGIKTIILSLALPATIFIALLKIEFEPSMIFVPLLVWCFNLMLYVLVDKLPIQSLFNVPISQHRVAILLLPSLAPGLSCFPFILEFGGELPFAMAALGDIGNKIFVLIIAYLIAMKWYLKNNMTSNAQKGESKLKDLLRALVEEPVNFVIVTAIVMLSLGLNFESLPDFITANIDRLSVMMTPLVLLFIGISMKLTRQQAKVILSFLFFRSGIAFLFSSILLLSLPVQDPAIVLLIVVFPQSACSFWPFAHMASISELERKSDESGRKGIFDLEFAMNILACSLPFSVILILAVYSSGEFFINVTNSFISGGVCLFFAALPLISHARFIKNYKTKVREVLRSI